MGEALELALDAYGAYEAGGDLGQAFMDWADSYEGGNPIGDALMDWFFNEYQEPYGSSVGDFGDDAGAIA